MPELYDEIQKAASKYPQRRSAVMPALRLAQERYGWLSPEALREVADALDLTPAYCKAVASFYDMYHLEPVGRKRGRDDVVDLACGVAGPADLDLHVVRADQDGRPARRGRSRCDGDRRPPGGRDRRG